MPFSFALSAHAIASGDGATAIPSTSICDESKHVDRHELAIILASRYAFSAAYLDRLWALPPATGETHDIALRRYLDFDRICSSALSCKDDFLAYQSAESDYTAMSKGQPPYVGFKAPPSDRDDLATFLKSENNTNSLACPPTPPAKTTSAPSLFKSIQSEIATHLALRGTADGLYVERESSSPFKGPGSYDAVQGASFAIKRDGVANTAQYSATGALGWEFRWPASAGPDSGTREKPVADGTPGSDKQIFNADYFSLIPYLGANRNYNHQSSNTNKSAGSGQINTMDYGLSATTFTAGEYDFLRANLRPDYLFNFADGSRLATLNGRLQPIVDRIVPINSYARLIAAKDQSTPGFWSSVSYNFILEPHLDIGDYTVRGAPSAATHNRNFVRAGGLVGLDFISQDSQFPLEFQIAYTGLHGFSGSQKTISYFNPTLSWSLTQTKFAAIQLSFINGNREDTGQEQKQVQLGITGKF